MGGVSAGYGDIEEGDKVSKIKARVPLAYKGGAAAERMRSMNLCFIFTGFVLYNYFDFTEEQLQEFMSKIAMFFSSEKKNDTIADEAIAWAEKHNFMERVR